MSLLEAPGDLSSTPLAAVLLEALNTRASGVLEVAHGGGTSRVWFREGRPVGAQVFVGFRPLGQLLLQAGLIDIDALSVSLQRMAETRRPQGELLVEMGAVSRGDVDRVLGEQQGGYFGLIAALDSGAFAFEASAAVPDWTRGSRLSPLRTIVDALERPQASALVVSSLRPIAGGVLLGPGYADEAEGFHWTPAERVLVARLERAVSLEAFFAPSDVAPERARAALAALLLLGLAVPAGAPAEAGDATGITRELTPPPRAAGAGTAPAAPARRGDPVEARARRQRLLQQAIRNMGVGPFGSRARAPAPQPVPPSRVDAPAPPRPASGTPEAALREALFALAPRVKERDLFARLGVPPTAGRDEVKNAFLKLARQFHPDRFAASALADLQDQVRDLFSAVNEAYEVLSDDRRRAEYLASRQGATTAQAEAARVDFQKGEACLRTRDVARARGFFESALRADPRPEHQAALAHALVVDPEHPDRDRARKLLAEAMRDRGCDRAFFVAGLVARDQKDDDAAERLFRAAIQANPRNVDAVRELRAVERRRSDRRR
jgi:tetratricopeptide (TPR) repeat protein